jgi:hippurate hydrolase
MNAPESGSYLGASRALQAMRAWHSELTDIRRTLHEHPELGFEEHFTAELVARELQRFGVDEIHRGVGRTGVVGVIRGRSTASGRSIGLRADMDALPMSEEGDPQWRSKRPGMMHACGHDGHTTMLLGAARHLALTRQFDGTVHLIFQPGEEGFAGARTMIQDGLFGRFPCDAVYAMHNWPALAPGQIAVRPGPIMAASDRITIRVKGHGGHGAHPYMTIDPVLVAGHLITAIQSIVARNVKAIDSAVISLCAMQAGDLRAMSVIPHEATLVGTVRTFRPEVQQDIEHRLRTLIESVAAGFGARAELDYQRGYPATVNTEAESLFAAEVARELVGEDKVITHLEPSMGSEDFSFMLLERPGAYFRLGQGGASAGRFLHNACYDFNDEVLPLGAALFARLAERAMACAIADEGTR